MHFRSRILADIVARLAAIPGFSEPGKVRRGRNGPIPQESLPALTPTWAEGSETTTIRPCAGPNGEDGYDRVLPVSIIVHLRDDDADEEFDRLALLIETAMGEAMTLGGLVVQVLQTSSRLYIDPRTGLSLGAGAINFDVYYKTVAHDPATAAA